MENRLARGYSGGTMHTSSRRLAVTAAVAAACAVFPSAQTGRPFTADDMLKVATASVLDLSDDGRRVAVGVRRPCDNAETDNRRYGDPTYLSPARVTLQVIDTQTGAIQSPFPGLVEVRQAAWSRDGKRLAILTASNGAPATLHIWDADRKTLSEVPRKAPVASGSGLEWTADDSRLIVALRNPDADTAAAARFKALTDGPIIVQSSKDPFLDWDDLQRALRTRAIASVNPATGEATTILPDRKVSSYRVSRDSRLVTFMEDVTEKTDYDTIGGTMNALRAVDASGGSPRTIAEAKDLKDVQLRWSDDGKLFAYAKKGEIFVQAVDPSTALGAGGAKARSLTPRPPAKPDEGVRTEAERAEDARTAPESFSAGAFSRDGAKLLITSRKGWYVVNVGDAAKSQVLTLDPEKEDKAPKIAALGWAPDGASIYVTYSAPDKWERGVMRLPLGRAAGPAASVLEPLIRDARLYSGLQQSRDGSTFVFSLSDGDRPASLYAADKDFKNPHRLIDVNPAIADVSVPRSELVAYRDADGKELYGVLRYPVNYVKGQKYPTVFELYETFFDNGFNARATFLANHGYAVFHPSVNLVVGRPGEAWLKGVTAAANRLIELGVADPDRLGVQGTSYGGYATVLLITQTERFKAAVNVSGKVDMVSFYTDSPRLGVRNTHAPEKSQDRIGGTLWEYPERYLDHSAILRADRIKTPLLTISGDQDPNVPGSQSREIFYALRRLGKEVEWVHYANGAHRPPNSVAESVDFENRILAWYEKYLKADSKKKTGTL
jgi:dipeptidyl aminopeptidase/acylaminoacyl peptidase